VKNRHLAVLVVLIALVVASPVSAGPVTISLVPSALNVAPDGAVVVSVNMAVGGADITMTAINAIIFYNPAVFTYVGPSVVQGAFLTHDWVGPDPLDFPMGDSPAPGELRVAPIDWDGGELFLAGTSGTLFTFTLQANAAAVLGPSTLSWGNGSFLGDGFGYGDGYGIDVLVDDSRGTSINVVGASVPDPGSSLLLLGMGVAGLAAARRRWR
jgi:hypothetical protein